MKKATWAAWLLCLVLPAAWADAGLSGAPSVGAGLAYELPDNARDSDNGIGGYANFYMPLQSRPGESFETDFYGLTRDREGGGSDTQFGLFANYSKNFGRFGWEQEEGLEKYFPNFAPFVLGGVGVVRDDVQGSDHYSPVLDLGAGLLFPINTRGLAVRTEARLVGQFNDKSVSGESFLLDVQFRVGLQFGFGAPAAAGGEPPIYDTAPPQECGLAVVDPVKGRSDCQVDSDRDGVADHADLCPGTPAGTPVDLNGCASMPEYDGDGILDSDHDGVPDGTDACPGTLEGVKVDAKGCEVLNTRKVVLSNVRFAKDSAELTAQAKSMLDEAARGLNGNTEIVVEVAGHADTDGRPNYNMMLSLLRAENVRQYLIDKGVSRYRLFVEGYGDTKPVAPNNTPAGRAQNRRVDLDKLDVKVTETPK